MKPGKQVEKLTSHQAMLNELNEYYSGTPRAIYDTFFGLFYSFYFSGTFIRRISITLWLDLTYRKEDS